MTRLALKETDCHPYYLRYIDKVSEETSLLEVFRNGKNEVIAFFNTIPENKLEYRYKPGKWSIKEVLQHLIDTERIFMYRCFRLSRRDDTSLAGFEQERYIEPSGASRKSLSTLLREFEVQRNCSLSLLSSLNEEDLSFLGTADGVSLSARAAAFTIVGHEIWHMEGIAKNYL